MLPNASIFVRRQKIAAECPARRSLVVSENPLAFVVYMSVDIAEITGLLPASRRCCSSGRNQPQLRYFECKIVARSKAVCRYD